MPKNFYQYSFLFNLLLFGLFFAFYLYPEALRHDLAFESIVTVLLLVVIFIIDMLLYKKHLKLEQTSKQKDFKGQTVDADEEHLMLSLESLPFGYILFDGDKTVIESNSAASAILGKKGKISFDILSNALGKSLEFSKLFGENLAQQKYVEQRGVKYGRKFLRVQFIPVNRKHFKGCVIAIFDETSTVQADKSREEFFAVASHELRAPLASIRGNLAVVRDYFSKEIKNKEVLQSIDQSHASAIRLIKIVNDFLDIARLEQGKTIFSVSQVNILEIIDEVINEMSYLATHKGDKLYFDRPKDLPPAAADSNRLKQVVYNLLGNAINYTSNGSIKVGVIQATDDIKVTITDTGSGIAKDKQALLFKKFQPVGEDSRTRDITQSTGMGLYISKLLLDAQSGSIGLEQSEPGKGSIFYFTIPISKT